jgi:hypothetical protein
VKQAFAAIAFSRNDRAAIVADEMAIQAKPLGGLFHRRRHAPGRQHDFNVLPLSLVQSLAGARTDGFVVAEKGAVKIEGDHADARGWL